MPADALTIATIETGVALRRFDAERLDGASASATPHRASRCPAGSRELAAGTLTIADESGPVGFVFGETAAGRAVERESRRIAIVAVGVGAVPAIRVEEALWIAAATVEGA